MSEQGKPRFRTSGGITLTWKDLSVYSETKEQRFFRSTATSHKRIVDNACGAVYPGSLVAIMGGSGAGKTTLMSTLAHRNPPGMLTEGEVRVNGRPVGEFMHRLSGYMYQEDLFVRSLTVREHLGFMARLRLDRRTSAAERSRHVAELLSQLGLTKCTDTRIARLSGGEKKRVSFATEMLTDPDLLFCDEPTTGLDSYSAQKLVHMMKAMAGAGKTVLCTIHQPSSEIFDMFHQLVLVADGRVAFMGDKKAALEFFGSQGYKCPVSYNPAEFFIRSLAILPGAEETSRLAVRRLCDSFAVSDAAIEVDSQVQLVHNNMKAESGDLVMKQSDFRPPFWITKLLLVTYRASLHIVRDPTVHTIRMMQKLGLALVYGLCFLGSATGTQVGIQNVQGILYILIIENVFPAMRSVVAMFYVESPLFLREHHNGLYSTAIYYISKIAVMLPGLILEPVLFVMIAYWMIGLRNTLYAVSMTTLIIALTSHISAACGMFFANVFGSMAIASTFMVPLESILVITSGLFMNLSSLPVYVEWTRYLSWVTYAYESLSIVQWEGKQDIPCDSENPELCLPDGEHVLSNYSFSTENLQRNLWAMLGLYVSFHLLSYLCLCRRAKK